MEMNQVENTLFDRLAAFIGFLVIIGIGFAICNNKKRINWKTFFWGVSLQFIFAFMVLRGQDTMEFLAKIIPLGIGVYLGVFVIIQFVVAIIMDKYLKEWVASNQKVMVWFKRAILFESLLVFLRYNLLEKVFVAARELVTKIIECSGEGATMVFGTLAKDAKPVGFVFAFGVLPTIIFVASIFAVLYYFGIMQIIVRFFAKLMSQFMGTSGAESTSVAASIFMGQTEAPLTIKPFIAEMTMSELMTMMTAGMAHVSGGIMAAYVMIAHVDIKHLLAAVIMTAPGAIFMSKLMVPEVEEPKTGAEIKADVPIHDVNFIDAAARGATEGGVLVLNVVAMLVAFISLIALVNWVFCGIHKGIEHIMISAQQSGGAMLSIFTGLHKIFPESLQQLVGWIFAPLAWCMGVPWKDAQSIGNLMGTRMILNEFIAFQQLGQIKESIDPKSFVIATYALCGFANLGSVAIQVGGIGALAPTRRHDLARLGIKAMLAGTLANYLTGTIAGMLIK
jgi:CNT family concentrative nucleoside transporter